MDDHKKRIQLAIEKFIKKNNPKRLTRKNLSPERDLQKELIKHLNSIGWSVQSVESKSTFDPRSGRYVGVAAKHGTSDLVGNDSNGCAVFIELKAPGRIGTLREKQREFLIQKIKSNAFACVIDSLSLLIDIYSKWSLLPLGVERQKFLTSLLPKEKIDPPLSFD